MRVRAALVGTGWGEARSRRLGRPQRCPRASALHRVGDSSTDPETAVTALPAARGRRARRPQRRVRVRQDGTAGPSAVRREVPGGSVRGKRPLCRRVLCLPVTAHLLQRPHAPRERLPSPERIRAAQRGLGRPLRAAPGVAGPPSSDGPATPGPPLVSAFPLSAFPAMAEHVTTNAASTTAKCRPAGSTDRESGHGRAGPSLRQGSQGSGQGAGGAAASSEAGLGRGRQPAWSLGGCLAESPAPCPGALPKGQLTAHRPLLPSRQGAATSGWAPQSTARQP